MTVTGGDIKLFPRPSGQYAVGPADIEVVTGASDVTRDPGLQTAVTIAVFTNCRADADDRLPFDYDGLGGWWAESVIGEKFGSKLWLLYRDNLITPTLTRAKEYIEDALDRHIISENIAKAYTVECVKDTDVMNRMKISITVTALDNVDELYEYYINWQSQTGRV